MVERPLLKGKETKSIFNLHRSRRNTNRQHSMVDTGQYLSPSDREILAQRRIRREADAVVQKLRREVRNLRNEMALAQDDVLEKLIRKMLITTKRKLIRRINQF